MKKIIVLCLTLGLVFSCSKEDNNDINITEEITIHITNDITYQYRFGFFDDDEGAEISIQASNYVISEVVRSESSGYSLYKYKPQLNFTGGDYVELIFERIIDSESDKKKITTVKLTFNVL